MARLVMRQQISAIAGDRVLLGQIVRFGLTGVFMTASVAFAYWLVAELFDIHPMVSMTLVYVAFTGLGYFLHSNFSFKGHGTRDRMHVRTARFFTVNTIGFLTNQFFVWLLTQYLHGPNWWPVIPICLVTPILTFTLNRKWVFG